MKRVDFSKIIIKGIEGQDIEADFQKQLGNQLYMQGRDIEACQLGKKIYFADGIIELSTKECDIVKDAIGGYSYVARTAIEEAMSDVE